MRTNKQFIAKNKGYTLLFAVLVSTIVLGVALFIVDVSKKQFELSVSSRNSAYAFYAADSGIECAVNANNWTNLNGFSSSTGGTLVCGSGTVTMTEVNPPVIFPTTLLTNDPTRPIENRVRQQSGYISLNYAPGGSTIKQCALITITTGWSTALGEPLTVVDSRGYNFCKDTPVEPDISNSATVERAIRLQQAGVW